MDRYKELKPRLPQDRYSYAILEQLVELNENIKSLTPKEISVPVSESAYNVVNEIQEVKEKIKKARKPRKNQEVS